MSQLAGKFAGILRVSVNDNNADKLIHALENITDQLKLVIERADADGDIEFQQAVTKSQLSKIKEITKIESRADGWMLYSETEDLRPHLSRFSQENNLIILTLQLEQKSLSSVFKDLTK